MTPKSRTALATCASVGGAPQRAPYGPRAVELAAPEAENLSGPRATAAGPSCSVHFHSALGSSAAPPLEELMSRTSSQ